MESELYLYFSTFFKIFIGFIVIISYLKITNKVQMAELTPIDYIGNFILGGIIGGIIYNPDISLLKYLTILLFSVSLIAVLNFLSQKFMAAHRLVRGSSYIIIEKGKFKLDSLSNKDIKFDMMEFIANLRIKGIFSLSEVEFAQIETNGGLSVIKKGDGHLNFLLVKSGQILEEQLTRIGKNSDWLTTVLNECHLSLEDIFIIEFSKNCQLYIVKNDETTIIKPLN